MAFFEDMAKMRPDFFLHEKSTARADISSKIRPK